MKTVITKTLLAAALTAAVGVGSTSAMAVVYPDFTVTEGSVPGTPTNTFVGDKITGNYVEVVTFTPTSATSGTFDTSIKWNAGQYVGLDGTTPQSTVGDQYLGTSNTLGGYGMYALLQGSGTYAISGSNVTTFNFSPGGNLDLWIDPLKNTGFTAPGTGTGAWTTSNNGDPDYLIASGAFINGVGKLDPSLLTCGSTGINCGSFGTTTSFDLTALGSGYFTAPVPFYNLSFQSGQLNNFTVAGTQTINGSLDVVFGNTVPEPATLGLLGLGLLGLGLARRGRRQA